MTCEVFLLPSGRFPRFIFVSAVILILLLVLDLVFVPVSPANLLISNCLDLAMVALGAFSCFYLSRRAAGYPRQIWILVAIAFYQFLDIDRNQIGRASCRERVFITV